MPTEVKENSGGDPQSYVLPALRYELEGFSITGERIMGRQSAGEGFLRAMVDGANGSVVTGYGPSVQSKSNFERQLRGLDANVSTNWIEARRLDLVAELGALHTPDPSIKKLANLRMRTGVNSFSITGVTHTVSSAAAMGHITDLVSAPVMEWDALICTSRATHRAVTNLLDDEERYVAWRLPGAKLPNRPQLPIIPLGIHCRDYAYALSDRVSARARLRCGDDEVVFLFLGRLSYHGKAHPFPMYAALEAAARHTGKKVALVQCGWFAHQVIESDFKAGARAFAPSVRHIWLDGRDASLRAAAWASSDVFISLADNIQETFGLSPLEAMAAGKPVVATDWDGYRDTIQHGKTGILIPTAMPSPPLGEDHALSYASEAIDYNWYIGLVSQSVVIDLRMLIQAVAALVEDKNLRRSMGERGRALVAANYDWSVVFAQYRELWAELLALRMNAQGNEVTKAPKTYSTQPSPYGLFSHYATSQINENTRLSLMDTPNEWKAVANDSLFRMSHKDRPPDAHFEAIISELQTAGKSTISEISDRIHISLEESILITSYLAKWGVVDLWPDSTRKNQHH